MRGEEPSRRQAADPDVLRGLGTALRSAFAVIVAPSAAFSPDAAADERFAGLIEKLRRPAGACTNGGGNNERN